MLKFGMGELIVIFLIILVLFGASRLPEIGKSLGRAIKEFKRAGKEAEGEEKKAAKDSKGEAG